MGVSGVSGGAGVSGVLGTVSRVRRFQVSGTVFGDRVSGFGDGGFRGGAGGGRGRTTVGFRGCTTVCFSVFNRRVTELNSEPKFGLDLTLHRDFFQSVLPFHAFA